MFQGDLSLCLGTTAPSSFLIKKLLFKGFKNLKFETPCFPLLRFKSHCRVKKKKKSKSVRTAWDSIQKGREHWNICFFTWGRRNRFLTWKVINRCDLVVTLGWTTRTSLLNLKTASPNFHFFLQQAS